MDDIDKRLKETSETCIKCYEEWSKNQKDTPKREAMQEAIHELRKVAARLEIEMAISERDEMASKPIPIPAHRSSSTRRNKNNDGGDNGKGDAQVNNGGGGGKGGPKVERKGAPRRRKSGSDDS